uniref:Uncharacterized protein n=1 Tax=Tanacetum cinerariifolium TaxID=118510 RepID=A0A6L2LTQ1_TANCI|nr:hypothetical protein [Tanacetum cinerariifolium]
MVAASKVPILKPVIENGNAPQITKVVEGVKTKIAPTTAEEKAQRSTSNTNGAVNNAHGTTTATTQAIIINLTTINNLSDAVICAFFTRQPNSPQLDNEDLQQVHPDDLKEMDLRWQMAMLTMRAMWSVTNGRKFFMNGNGTIGFDKSKVECYNCHKRRRFDRECRAPKNKDIKHKESTKRTVPVEIPGSLALVSCDGLESVEARLLVYKKNELVYEEDIKVLKCLGYNVVPPPNTRNYMPPKPDFSFSGLEEFMNEPIVSKPTVKKVVFETSKAKDIADKPKDVRKNFGSPLIKDWISDSEDEAKSKPKIEKKTDKPSFAKREFVKSKEQKKCWIDNERKLCKNKQSDLVGKRIERVEHVVDKAINEEMNDSLVKAATTASSLEAEHDSGVNTPRSDEDSLKLKELMELCTTLQSRVLALEQTKATQANDIDSLQRKVKILKKKQRSRTQKLKRLYKVSLTAGVESSDDDEDLGDDASKQGRISTHDDVDQDLSGEKAKGIVFHELEESTTRTTATIPKSKSQDNNKGIMVEEPVKLKKKDQIQLDEEVTLKLQAELQDEFDKEQILPGERAQ